MRPPSETQARTLLKAACGDRLEAFYVLALHTGMRRGELLGLKWDGVDLDASTLRVRRTQTREENGKRPALGEHKTKKSRRTVRLTPQAADALKHHRARQAEEKLGAGGVRGSGPRVCGQDREAHRAVEPPASLVAAAARARRAAPDHLPRPPPHLRFAPVLEERPPQVPPGAPGTRLVTITLDTYSHMLPGMGGETTDAMGEALG